MDDESLSLILKAAGDTSPRRILTLLAQEGPLRVTALAAHFEISLNSVSKHIKVLEEAGPGMTDATLRQERFHDQRAHDLHAEGWGVILGQLGACMG